MLSAGPAADATPGQPGHQLLGGFARDVITGAEPVPGGHLGHADQADAQQVRLVAGESGVFPDRLADHLGAPALDLVEPGVPSTMPDLIQTCLDRGEVVAAWPLHSDWIDVGTPLDLARAKGHA